MKGRSTFSANELHAIETTLRQLPRTEGWRRRSLHERLRRRYRFYVSDFKRDRRPFTADDVELLVSQGVIRIRF